MRISKRAKIIGKNTKNMYFHIKKKKNTIKICKSLEKIVSSYLRSIVLLLNSNFIC